MLSQGHIVKLTLNIANWCKEGNLPITEQNINRYLAIRMLSLNVEDLRQIYDSMLGSSDDIIVDEKTVPYTYTPVTIHRRSSPKMWVPTERRAGYVVPRRGPLGTEHAFTKTDLEEILDSRPRIESKERRIEYERMLEEKKKLAHNVPTVSVDKKPKKKVVLFTF